MIDIFIYSYVSFIFLILERTRLHSHYLREAIIASKARTEALRRKSVELMEEMRRLTSTSTRLTGRLQHTTTAILRKSAVFQSSESLQVCIWQHSFHNFNYADEMYVAIILNINVQKVNIQS